MIMPVMVDPVVGAVMLTIRLPPPGSVMEPPVCAEAAGGDIKCAPRMTNTATNTAHRTEGAGVLVFIAACPSLAIKVAVLAVLVAYVPKISTEPVRLGTPSRVGERRLRGPRHRRAGPR